MFYIGIAGCGKISQVRHIPEYENNPNAVIAGFFDLNQERAVSMAKAHGGKACSTFEELLALPHLDAVSICTANHNHAEMTIAALRAGKHVLCEKPMATSLEECQAMVDAAKESGRFLMIGHNQRLVKTHARAKQLISEGLIGELLSFRTTFGHGGPETWSIDSGDKNLWFFDKNRASLGAMGDLGIHKTDLIQYLTGSRVREVSARLVTLDKKDSEGKPILVDDNAFCIYTMDSGIVGTMHASWTFCGQEDNSTILYGTKGIMRIYDSPDASIRVILKDGSEILYRLDQIQTNDNQTASGVIDLFIDCLVNDRPPEISGEEALWAMRAVFACVESSKTGKQITVF